jgi:hypothetical protein
MLRLSGLAAMLGGAVWVTKGGLIIVGIADLGNFLIVAELFFAVALIGLHFRLGESAGWTGRVGGFLAYVAAALSAVNAPIAAFFAGAGPRTPFPFNVTFAAASLSIVVGLMLLGFAALREEILPPIWQALPLIAGLSALLPVWILAFLHIELPILVIGLSWMLLGYVLWSDDSEPSWQTGRVR